MATMAIMRPESQRERAYKQGLSSIYRIYSMVDSSTDAAAAMEVM
jgi:hypothetical protein